MTSSGDADPADRGRPGSAGSSGSYPKIASSRSSALTVSRGARSPAGAGSSSGRSSRVQRVHHRPVERVAGPVEALPDGRLEPLRAGGVEVLLGGRAGRRGGPLRQRAAVGRLFDDAPPAPSGRRALVHHHRLALLAGTPGSSRSGSGRSGSVRSGSLSSVVPEVVPEVVVRRAVGPRRGVLLDQHLVHRLGVGVLRWKVGHRRGGLGVGGHLVPEHPDVPLVVQRDPDRQGLPQRRPLGDRHPGLDDLLGPRRQPRRVDHQLQLAAAEGVLGGWLGGAVHVAHADHPGAPAAAHGGQRDRQHQQGDAERHDGPAGHAQPEEDDEGGHGAQHRADQLAYRRDGPVPAIRHCGPPGGQGQARPDRPPGERPAAAPAPGPGR